MNSFDRIAGYEKEKEALIALAEIFKNRKKYELKGASLPRGIIFYGPAGTGKTLFSEVLAKECSLKKVNISLSDSASEGNICRQIRKAFLNGARGGVPTMVFFDELDKVLPNESEDYYTDKSKAILAQLLTLIDGMEKINNVVFVATCNDYRALPESITRPGRFDKKICLGLPDYASRTAILDMYIKASPAKLEVPTESIARLTGEFSPAALKTLVNECILASDENSYISEELIHKKIAEIKEEDIPTERSEQSYTVDAVRNIGAFVIARAYSKSDYVLTIEENKVCNGFLDAIIENADYDYDDEYYDDEDEEKVKNSYSLCSKNDLLAAMTALFGGLAAEELIFSKIYDNLKSSMDYVDDIVFKMVSCGMLGIRYYYNEHRDYTYSEKRREELEEKILSVKEECYQKATALISKNEALIRSLVPILLKRKSIERKECEELLEKFGGIIAD